jgi:nitroimidazol reductase NimA-like FMN-containing flavoprotein (pyridoxamine 5'-phosphate oxidase superfamily)
MRIVTISQDECIELLQRVSVGRLACSLNDHPYVVPVGFAYDNHKIYAFSTLGQKIEWMRQNPNVCMQVDEIGNRSNWISVVASGAYVELREPQYTAQKEHAKERLGQYSEWWRTPLAGRREQVEDLFIEPIFFRIDIDTMTGLRSIPESE